MIYATNEAGYLATAFPENTPDAYNQVVWHVPTTGQKLTTLQWIELVAKELNVAPKVQPLSTRNVAVIGIIRSCHEGIS